VSHYYWHRGIHGDSFNEHSIQKALAEKIWRFEGTVEPEALFVQQSKQIKLPKA